MKNNPDVLDNARNLGYSVTKSVEYKNLLQAEEDYYNDRELLELLEELKNAKEKDDSNNDEINKLEIKISQNKSMISYTDAKDKYDELFKSINNLISYITDGQSRPILGIDSNKKDCSSCSGCSSGCSK